MKILIVNSYDIHGGAARAAYRLHKGLQSFGIDSKMLVQKKFSDDDTVITCINDNSKKIAFYDKTPLKNYQNKTKTLFSTAIVSNHTIVDFINNYDADIVHLHWINNGFLSLNDIGRIKKPIVWSLHDMWAFTGGCHYDEECKAYEKECKSCKVLQSTSKKDLSNKIWNIKKTVFQSCKNLTIIGLSSWLANCAKKSFLFQNKNILQLPNPIDTNLFSKENYIEAREFFNLPKDKKLILFGAMGGTSDPRKGYKELISAIELLNAKDVELVVFGNSKEKQSLKYKIHFIGQIEDDNLLKKLYSSVNLMIVPSLQENLSNTIMEALSCSTPVVTFDIGGNRDMIEHKKNGYLAKPFSAEDLAFGISWVLFNKNYKELCKNARNKVIRDFSYNSVIPKYIKEYKRILSNFVDISYDNNYQEELLSQSINIFHSNKNQKMFFSNKFNNLFQRIDSLKKEDLLYVVYGNGTIGKTIQALMPEKILGYVDMADENNHPKNLKNMEYDKIIISVLGREEEIIKYLSKKLNIGEDKIITLEL